MRQPLTFVAAGDEFGGVWGELDGFYNVLVLEGSEVVSVYGVPQPVGVKGGGGNVKVREFII